MFEAAKPAGFQVFTTVACGLLGNAFSVCRIDQ
jgi:hypothetical protein